MNLIVSSLRITVSIFIELYSRRVFEKIVKIYFYFVIKEGNDSTD